MAVSVSADMATTLHLCTHGALGDVESAVEIVVTIMDTARWRSMCGGADFDFRRDRLAPGALNDRESSTRTAVRRLLHSIST